MSRVQLTQKIESLSLTQTQNSELLGFVHGATACLPEATFSPQERFQGETKPCLADPTLTSQPLFVGKFLASLDPKHRIIIPASFRTSGTFDQGIVLSMSPQGCIWAFSKPEFQRIVGEMQRALRLSPGTFEIKNFLTNHSCFIPALDGAGRVTIDPSVRDAFYNGAEAPKQVVMNGCGNLIEIWLPNNWNEHVKAINVRREQER